MDLVGLTFLENAPEGVERPSGRRSHCRLTAYARQGKRICAGPEDISCPVARFHLGLQKANALFLEKLAENVARWYKLDDLEIARNYVARSARLPEKDAYILYEPYDGSQDPDVVIAGGRPREIMELVRDCTLYLNKGERPVFKTGGIAATCCETTAIPLLTDAPNLSLGCCGTRSAGELPDDEVLLGIPKRALGVLKPFIS